MSSEQTKQRTKYKVYLNAFEIHKSSDDEKPGQPF